jgi:O-glycosyl hydrolase
MVTRAWAILLTLWLPSLTVSAAPVTFDGSVTNQVIDGFGVNANHRSWNGDELKPVLDAFIDQAGMTLFRVVFDQTDWETNNDNGDPAVMNWDYYNAVYGSATFTPLWDMMQYLNSKGITNGSYLCFMGSAPSWLGGHNISDGLEPEWAEMITSLLHYARNTKGIGFNLVAPDNEPSQWSEGIQISTASQYVTALQALAQRLDANGLSDVRFIAPDYISGGTSYIPEMLANSVIMDKLGRWGVHPWMAPGSSGVYDFIRSSAYPNINFWVTEYNVWCSGCDTGTRGTYDWNYCKGTATYLMQYLADGASAGIVWEGYDSYYIHATPSWSFWGLFSVDNEKASVKTYTPRKNFYTVAQISKWVRPGAQRIGVSGSVSSLSPLLAFRHEGLGQITIVGINNSDSAVAMSGVLASLPTVSSLDLYYTSATTNLAYRGSVAVNNGSFNATIPADCVFTLTGFAGVNVALTSPVNGAQFNEPATIPLEATAATSSGSIANVQFYAGSDMLGESTNAPYGFTWTNVAAGDYALTAVATDTGGNSATSAVVNIAVAGPPAQIDVTPASASVAPGGAQQFSATASDPMGRVLNPQPAFSWSVSGGGTIDDAGRFTAGSSAGGPFNVMATSDGLTGTATVSVVAVGGGTIGNPKEGTSSKRMWAYGAWVNLCRFPASSNMIVATMYAKVGAISGGYKCGIYTDASGSPNALLGGTAEVRSPTNGWNVFPLASSITLTNGQYYWLAIWSDDANAKVYYSDSSGTLRWGHYNYGTWPNPMTTTGGGNLNFCIFASGVDVLVRRPLRLSGAVAYFPSVYPASGMSATRVGNVTMTVSGGASQSTATAIDGSFSLDNLPVGESYTVTPSKTDDNLPWNNDGVDVGDVLAVLDYYAGNAPLTSPYALLAADVNDDGSIDLGDALDVLDLAVGNISSFSTGRWRFVPADYSFPDLQAPWGAPNFLSYNNLTGDVSAADFVAIKLGDVDNTWTAPPSGQSILAGRDNEPTTGAEGSLISANDAESGVVFTVSQHSAQPGQKVSVGLSVNGFSRVYGAQFTLAWDPEVLRYEGTGSYGLGGLGTRSFGTTLAANGRLPFLWFDPVLAGATLPDGTVLFAVTFEVIGKPDSVSTVRLTDGPTLKKVSRKFALASFGSKDGSVAVVGPEVPGNQPGYAMGVFQLSVSTQKGLWYTLEFTDTMAPAKWRALSAVAGDGTVTILTDLAATNQQRFYRVRVE